MAIAVLVACIAACTAYYITSKNKKRLQRIPPRGERVLILGCSSGIGRDTALAYAARGAKLVLFARRKELLQQLKQECENVGSPQVHFVAGDVVSMENLNETATLLCDVMQGVDTVIYCAGMISVRPFLEASGITVTRRTDKTYEVSQKRTETDLMEEALHRITDINYFAAIRAARCFLPLLIETSKMPNFIVISSMAGKVGAPTRALYAGSKHALHGFFDSLRVEIQHYGVHVGLVCPGSVATDLRHSAVDTSLGSGAIAGSRASLSARAVANRIISASDQREREVYIPAWFGYAAVYAKLFASSWVDWAARRKYKFSN
ncbi:hypothetical protein EC973_001067 [Apophysomyces ossiformis]|uniref:Short chain dehydrogenase n=1 Tax=Apophysomyces ossiformis TaxID=679940 RepID=A0A8H7BWW1_9FUNG|nr:hypothetical protein EC973_001067 [Apophysomyces ossiformis]